MGEFFVILSHFSILQDEGTEVEMFRGLAVAREASRKVAAASSQLHISSLSHTTIPPLS